MSTDVRGPTVRGIHPPYHRLFASTADVRASIGGVDEASAGTMAGMVKSGEPGLVGGVDGAGGLSRAVARPLPTPRQNRRTPPMCGACQSPLRRWLRRSGTALPRRLPASVFRSSRDSVSWLGLSASSPALSIPYGRCSLPVADVRCVSARDHGALARYAQAGQPELHRPPLLLLALDAPRWARTPLASRARSRPVPHSLGLRSSRVRSPPGGSPHPSPPTRLIYCPVSTPSTLGVHCNVPPATSGSLALLTSPVCSRTPSQPLSHPPHTSSPPKLENG